MYIIMANAYQGYCISNFITIGRVLLKMLQEGLAYFLLGHGIGIFIKMTFKFHNAEKYLAVRDEKCYHDVVENSFRTIFTKFTLHYITLHSSFLYWPIVNKMLSYRRETALQGALQFSPKIEDWNWKTGDRETGRQAGKGQKYTDMTNRLQK